MTTVTIDIVSIVTHLTEVILNYTITTHFFITMNITAITIDFITIITGFTLLNNRVTTGLYDARCVTAITIDVIAIIALLSTTSVTIATYLL
jgi:hypothetical protein